MKLNTTARLKDISASGAGDHREADGAAPGNALIGETVPGGEIRRHTAGRAPRNVEQPEAFIAPCGSSFHPLPALEPRGVDAEEVEARAATCAATRSSDRSGGAR